MNGYGFPKPSLTERDRYEVLIAGHVGWACDPIDYPASYHLGMAELYRRRLAALPDRP